jgi:hypothetical protein
MRKKEGSWHRTRTGPNEIAGMEMEEPEKEQKCNTGYSFSLY